MHAPLQNSSFLKATSAEALRRSRQARKLNAVHQAEQSVSQDDEKCPVIRAHQVFITGGSSGKPRVVFF